MTLCDSVTAYVNLFSVFLKRKKTLTSVDYGQPAEVKVRLTSVGWP
jgi:hypothetical protein